VEQIIELFNENNIKYLVIGGQAIRLMGMPRYSMDWDIYIPGKDIGNINKINELLSNILNMELEPLGPQGLNFIQTFQTPYGILQFHLAPVAIAKFSETSKTAKRLTTETGVAIKCISPEELYKCKKKIARPQDEADILFLKNLLDR
jgi:hypothetical protein